MLTLVCFVTVRRPHQSWSNSLGHILMKMHLKWKMMPKIVLWVFWEDRMSSSWISFWHFHQLQLCKGNQFTRYSPVTPFTPKNSMVILLTICHTILMMLLGKIWYWINWLSPHFLCFCHFSAWYCNNIVRGNSVLVTLVKGLKQSDHNVHVHVEPFFESMMHSSCKFKIKPKVIKMACSKIEMVARICCPMGWIILAFWWVFILVIYWRTDDVNNLLLFFVTDIKQIGLYYTD